MSISKVSRRAALKLLLAGSVVSVGTACNTLQSLNLPKRRNSTDGSELAIRVQEALRTNGFTSHLLVTVTSNEDEVIIKGFVPSKGDIANVQTVANQVDGVRFALVDLYVKK